MEKKHYKKRRGDENGAFTNRPMETIDGTLKHPFTCIVAGPTGCGKTRWVRTLLERRESFVYPPPERIYWFYAEYQPDYESLKQTLPHVEFIEGLPGEEELKRLDVNRRKLIVIDDLMSELSPIVTALFTKGSHHRNLSVVLLVQNLFFKGGRTLSLNTHYLVFFKNPRDVSSIIWLVRCFLDGCDTFENPTPKQPLVRTATSSSTSRLRRPIDFVFKQGFLTNATSSCLDKSNAR